MKTTKEVFIENLRRFRKAKYPTQAKFAEALGMSTNGYQRYELGEGEPGPEMIGKIAKGLGVEPWQLLSPLTDNPVSQITKGSEKNNAGSENKINMVKEILHPLASDIAKQVLTALKSEPVVTSKDHEELIGLVRGMTSADAVKWLKVIRSTPHAIIPQDKSKSRTPR